MLHVVIPAYNEELNIDRLVTHVAQFLGSKDIPYRMTVVDDGSCDHTADIVREKSRSNPFVALVTYQPNRGVHEAFRRGFTETLLSAAQDDVILTMEADGTADLGLIERFLALIRDGADVVVSSYYAEGGSVEGTVWHRKLLSRAGNRFIRFFLPIPGIHTYSSFYRAYRPAALRAVLERYGDFYKETGFSCVVELLYRMHTMGLKLDEVPMVLRGSARAGKSKMKVLQTIFGYLRIGARGFTQKI